MTGAEGDTEHIRRLIMTAKGLWITDPPLAMASGIVEKEPVTVNRAGAVVYSAPYRGEEEV